MSTLTLRISDTKHERLKNLARTKQISMNKLFDEWATIALAQQDAQANYFSRKQRGDIAAGLSVLDKLDSLHPSE